MTRTEYAARVLIDYVLKDFGSSNLEVVNKANQTLFDYDLKRANNDVEKQNATKSFERRSKSILERN